MKTVYIKSPSGKPLCTLKFIPSPITVRELLIRAHYKIDPPKGPFRGTLNIDHLCLRPIYWPDTRALVPTVNVPLHLCNEYVLDTVKKMQSYGMSEEPKERFPWLFYLMSIMVIYCWYKYIYF